MAAFVTSLIVLIAGVAFIFGVVAPRRPVGTPVTWAEAILAAVFVFGLLLLAYGIVPNQFLLWADNELKWRADAIAYTLKFWGRGQVIVTKQAIRDIIAAVIYIVLLVLNVILWAKWQKRGQQKAAPAIEKSTFGRPLVRKV